MNRIEAEPLPATPNEELPNLAEPENQIGEVAEWSKALSQSAGVDGIIIIWKVRTDL